ncbi:hypothetical protein [Hyphomonas sp.]|uniref:hypothetical protein n=1 Tax=Hyphomonas sp. TaxID=87 RepID=UPI0025C5D967|nr:hypothetical protein [Hyphomonas sp.]MBI1401033.1 hypothetical protein [Hyphomonas sp.]
MARLVYLDQNAWIVLAKGAWDKERYKDEHAALTRIVGMVRTGSIAVPLSFSNIYETSKINDPSRRLNIAQVQSLISGGTVFRGRRRILTETLAGYLAKKLGILQPDPIDHWFLSDLWFEGAGDYSPQNYGFEIAASVIAYIREDPAHALLDYLASADDNVRQETVRRYSASSAELIERIEARRALVSGQPLAIRKRAYGARLIIDEFDFILAIARSLGLKWSMAIDIGSSLVRSIVVDVPVLNTERELVVRLEDQDRAVSENDLRDMMAFITVLPFADVMIAEKQFVNLTRQARLDERYGTILLTSIHDL